MRRLHIGCGTVYLRGWINSDIRSDRSHLASARPDLVEKYITDESDYYGRHQDKTLDTVRTGPRNDEYVCDEYGSFMDLPGSTWTIDELLCRHSFEHLSISEAHKALDEIDRKLKNGAILRIDVPDHDGAMKKLTETKDEFFIRHLLGPRNSDYGYHMMSYTQKGLRELVESHGFVYLGEEPNIHFYPAFCLKFEKPGGRLPSEYAMHGVKLEAGMKILDIGPGPYPLAQATHYIDSDSAVIRNLQDGKEFTCADIEKDSLKQIPDKFFDYVFCSHVLEHLEDPVAAIHKISRIGKRGTIVVPSAFKEFLFLWEENDHKWWIFPPKGNGPIIFMLKNKEWADALGDGEASKALCRIFRTGPTRLDHDQRLLRKWYYEKEPNLDVIYHWEGNAAAAYYI